MDNSCNLNRKVFETLTDMFALPQTVTGYRGSKSNTTHSEPRHQPGV